MQNNIIVTFTIFTEILIKREIILNISKTSFPKQFIQLIVFCSEFDLSIHSITILHIYDARKCRFL